MAGHICVGHCEFDKFANKSYIAMNKPKESEWFSNDIRSVRANDIPTADVWCFGFPCQDISVAGKQKGLDGARSGLFYSVIELIKGKEEKDKPTYLFIENVKNLISVNGGWDFARILISLDEVGYDAQWQIINSKYYGVPQNRERLFIIGHLRSRGGREVLPIQGANKEISLPIKILAHRQKYRRNTQVFSPNGITEAIDTSQGGGRGHHTIEIIGKLESKGHRGSIYSTNGIVGSLLSSDNKGAKQIAIPVLTPDRINKRQNGRRFKNNNDPMFTLTSSDRHGVAIREATIQGYNIANLGDSINLEQPNSNTRRGRIGKQIANTLTCGGNQDTLDGCRIRKLTPKEYFRLQGFSDEHFNLAKSVNSDSQLYKQAGNAVTVSVIYEIAKKLY